MTCLLPKLQKTTVRVVELDTGKLDGNLKFIISSEIPDIFRGHSYNFLILYTHKTELLNLPYISFYLKIFEDDSFNFCNYCNFCTYQLFCLFLF